MNDIEKKLEALKAEFLGKLEALEKGAETQKKQEEPKPWKPEDGEDYFYIGIDFTIDSWENVDDDTDKRNFRIGNCFPTKARAEQVDEHKFYLFYDGKTGNWKYTYWSAFDFRVGEYFDTEKNAEKAAKILNRELEEFE